MKSLIHSGTIVEGNIVAGCNNCPMERAKRADLQLNCATLTVYTL